MRELVRQINQVDSKTKKIIDLRIKQFKSVKDPFKELCFCILTANSTAEQCIRVHEKVNNGFHTLTPKKLQHTLQKCGARFHTKRAGYIVEARKKKQQLTKALKNLQGEELRQWIVDNIKGLGMKEASHFLRNIGYDEYAIIDFHIIDLLQKHNLITRPKTLNKNFYLQAEQVLDKISKKTNLTQAELDLYLWYLETGKVLK